MTNHGNYGDLSDADLCRSLKEGDLHALQELNERYGRYVGRLIRRKTGDWIPQDQWLRASWGVLDVVRTDLATSVREEDITEEMLKAKIDKTADLVSIKLFRAHRDGKL
jgi:hypothetical protein